MLFSITESGWSLIAVGASVFFTIGMPEVFRGMQASDQSRRMTVRRGRRVFYLLAPVLLALVLAINLLRPGPAAPILFLYSVVLVSIPITFLPVRGRIRKQTLIQQRDNPEAEIKPDRVTMAWMYGFVSTVILVAVAALMTTEYGQPS